MDWFSDDLREFDGAEKKGKSRQKTDGTGIDEYLSPSASAAHRFKSPAPNHKIEYDDIDDSEENSFVSENRLFERNSHETGV